MANAQEVLLQLNNTWSAMLDKFYDSVSDEYLKWMANEYNMDLKALREKAEPLKTKLLSKATEAVSAVKTTKKQIVKSKVIDDSKYGTMSRKELIDLCKSRSLAVKRKNQDMIDQLKKYDDENASESESTEENSQDSDREPELEVENVKKVERKTTKKQLAKPKTEVKKQNNSTPPAKNELLEETLESDSDED